VSGATGPLNARTRRLGQSDARQLAVAIEERRALVTFDVRDFSVLASAAAVGGTDHYGVVFVPPGRLAPGGTDHYGVVFVPPGRLARSDIGVLVNALADLVAPRPDDDAIKNRAIFLETA